MAEYEMSHCVDEYTIAGIHIWPLLRISACFNLYAKTKGDVPGPSVKSPKRVPRILGRLRSKLSPYWSWLAARCRDARHECRPDLRRRDAVFLIHAAGRFVTIQGGHYSVFVDPLVDELHGRDFSSLVWETAPRNEYRVPRYGRSAFISHRLDLARNIARFRRSRLRVSSQPPWFKKYSDWLVSLGGSRARYDDIVFSVSVLLRQAKLFEGWLRRIDPRVLFVGTWYSLNRMAALLAASRLGIRSVDLQHGLQGPGHFAYASWKKAPPGGYELLPTHFWVWGERDADTLRCTSGRVIPPKRVLIGGYPWLNLWRYDADSMPAFARFISKAKNLRGTASRSILVTLQGNVPLSDDFLGAIRESPRDWGWWIRLHPGMMREKGRISSQLRETNHPNIEIERATHLPLYSLLKTADVHVTGWSTCALEALAFGLHTILLHRNGREAFAEFVERGEMSFARTKDEFIQKIAAERSRDGVPSVETVFADKSATEQALDRLFSGCKGQA